MEPIYHTVHATVDDDEDDVIPSPNAEHNHKSCHTDGTTGGNPANGHRAYDATDFIQGPAHLPSYEPAQHDNLLWSSTSPFDSYPMASMSRDAYGIDDDDDPDENGRNRPKCGWGKFTPKCLQVLLNVKAYLVVFSMASLVQVMTSYGLVTIAITTIERRFHLSSFQSGAIMSAYQFATMAFTVFVTYIGENRHKPRWVGVGSLFLTVGAVVFTLPHFLSGPYVYQEYDVSDEGVCPLANATGGLGVDMCAISDETGTEQGGAPADYFWLFIVAQLFNSLAAAPLFTLGVTYMDDNLSSKSFSLYMGIYNAVMSFGPAAGFFIGVITLSLYTDFNTDMSSVTITPDNPLWVGAWWLGFLVSAVLITMCAFVIMAFPKTLPGMKKIQRARKNQSQKGSDFVARPGFGNSIRDAPRALIKILCNIPFLCLCVITITEYFIMAGMVVFSPKFIEAQFNINSRDVGKYVGVLAMTTHFMGSLVSGVLMKRLDLHFTGLVKLCLISVFASLLAGLTFIMHCPNAPIAGVSVHYINTSIPHIGDEGSLVADCNSHCACSENFEPVCGEDNVMYFSPCHAGCNEEGYVDGNLVFADCRCIILGANSSSAYDVTMQSSWEDPFLYGVAVPGRCKTSCSLKWLYLVLFWLFSFFGTMMGIPAWIATMRCVSHSQRAFALGVQAVFYGGLGTAPAPIIFGFLIDQACIRWDTSSCDGQGSCWVYDNKVFAHTLLMLVLCFKTVSIIFFILTLCCYKPADDDIDADDVYGPRRKRVPTTDL